MKKTIFALTCFLFQTIIFSQNSEYYIKERIIPEEYKPIHLFLETLKSVLDNSKSTDINIKADWSIAEITDHISSNGVLFIDPNEEYSKTLPKKQIISELKGKTGKSYELISHLASIYAVPYKQYSELKFSETDGGTVVYLAFWYKLTFEKVKDVFFLTGCEYLQIEGD
jgi:hypothetical protein